MRGNVGSETRVREPDRERILETNSSEICLTRRYFVSRVYPPTHLPTYLSTYLPIWYRAYLVRACIRCIKRKKKKNRTEGDFRGCRSEGIVVGVGPLDA